jgi:poly(hydroxyalkanoate) depolymerase family esterase
MILEATRLTRAGQLQRATALIRASLSGRAPAAGADAPDRRGVVVDAEVVRVPPDTPLRVDATVVGEAATEPATRPAPTPATEGRFVAGRFGTGALARDFKLFIPPGAGSGPLPLVVLLHGCKQDPDDFARGTAMNEAAARAGGQPFYALYPAQARDANVAKCWNWFKPTDQVRGGGEAGLIAALTADVIARHAIDPRRVYVAGLSAGGAMTAILGDAYPDLFAAIGVHSGLPRGAARDVPSAFSAMKQGARMPAGTAPTGAPVPTIVFHGDRDATVHPVNGEHVVGPRVAGLALEEEVGRAGRAWTRRRWRDDAGLVRAEHWIVHGGGHAWSGGRSAGSFTDPAGPDATAAMLAFFFAQERPLGDTAA